MQVWGVNWWEGDEKIDNKVDGSSGLVLMWKSSHSWRGLDEKGEFFLLSPFLFPLHPSFLRGKSWACVNADGKSPLERSWRFKNKEQLKVQDS